MSRTTLGISILLVVALATIISVNVRSNISTKRLYGTGADMQEIRIAMECYADGHNGLYPSPPKPINQLLIQRYDPNHYEPRENYFGYPPAAWPIGQNRNAQWLSVYLVPRCIQNLPLVDHWGHPIVCEVTPDLRHYTIVSYGRDGIPDKEFSDYWNPTDYDHDLILSDGNFISIPRGATRR